SGGSSETSCGVGGALDVSTTVGADSVGGVGGAAEAAVLAGGRLAARRASAGMMMRLAVIVRLLGRGGDAADSPLGDWIGSAPLCELGLCSSSDKAPGVVLISSIQYINTSKGLGKDRIKARLSSCWRARRWNG